MINKLFSKDSIVKMIIMILLALITYAQYFIVIPLTRKVSGNEAKIYNIELKIEKYQIRTSMMFTDILKKLEKFQ